MGCHFLLQEIFLTQGWNLRLQGLFSERRLFDVKSFFSIWLTLYLMRIRNRG